jgi:LysM repeat protein
VGFRVCLGAYLLSTATAREPEPAPPTTEPKGPGSGRALMHTVVDGETVRSIARMYDMKAEAILASNPGTWNDKGLWPRTKPLVPHR